MEPRRSTCHRRNSRPATSASRQGFVGANVTIPQQAALALADEASDAARRIGAANTLSFGTGRSAPTTPTTGLLAALPEVEDARRSSGSRRVGTAAVGRWPSRAPRSRSGTARRRGRRSWCDLARARSDHSDGRLTPVSGEQALANAYELIINCTAIGMRDEDPFEHLPLDPERWNAEIVLVDLVYSGSERADRRGPRGGARRRSAAWRSWSARAGSRCESGRVWIHRWRSCARQRSEQGSPDFRRARAHAYRATR